MGFNKRKKLPIIAVARPDHVCWFCDHIIFSAGSPCYSEVTPGTDFSLECGRGYWEFDQYGDSLDDFREQLETAQRCADFKDRGK